MPCRPTKLCHHRRNMRPGITWPFVVSAQLVVAVACRSAHGPAVEAPHHTGATASTPLVIAKQGSFFVNARQTSAPFPNSNLDAKAQPGHAMARGMYVQYQ